MHRVSPRVLRALMTAIGIAGVLVGPTAAHATVALELDLPSMTQRSEHIVHGVVLAREGVWERGHIYTVTRVGVLDSVKGGLQAGKTLEVKQLGGQVGNLVMRVAGQVAFEV